MAGAGEGAEDLGALIHRLGEGVPKPKPKPMPMPMRGSANTAPLIGAAGGGAVGACGGGAGCAGAATAAGGAAARSRDTARARCAFDEGWACRRAAVCSGPIGDRPACVGSSCMAIRCACDAGAGLAAPTPCHASAMSRAWASKTAVAVAARRALSGISGDQYFTSPWMTRGASLTSGFAPM